MYSRYLPPEEAFSPLPPEEAPPPPPGREPAAAPPGSTPPHRSAHGSAPQTGSTPPRGGVPSHLKGPVGELLGSLTQELNKLLGGAFHLESLDTGDILLFLIVLLLFLDGDDVDLAIALGLTLLLSLGEQQSGSSPPADTAPSHPEA